jgi:outer membrane lipoprotein LolB
MINKNLYSIFYLLFFTFSLNSCGLQTLAIDSKIKPIWEQHKESIENITNWHINGAIAFHSMTNDWNARFNWVTNPRDYYLGFNAPLGQGAFLITGNSAQATMRTANNHFFHDKDAESLLINKLNINLPIEKMLFWLKGIHIKNDSNNKIWHLKINQQGLLTELSQGDWKIFYSRYNKINNVFLPKKIILSNKDFKIKIIVTNWKI